MSARNVVVSVVLAILFTWFALVNSTTVTVSLIFRSYTLSLSLIILCCILIGVIITAIISLLDQRKLMGRIRELEKEVKKEEKLMAGEEGKKA